MHGLNKILALCKVDEAKRQAWGIATAEIPDKTGEICDYEAAKSAYQTWSAEAQKATSSAGQEVSFGNVRFQHTAKPVGKVIDIEYRDADKQIYVGTYIDDDDTWRMIQKGILTGFSQGGDYAWRRCATCGTDIYEGFKCAKCNKAVDIRYAPTIAEISTVDNPCLPTAHFQVVKADGSIEMRKFANGGEQMATGAAVPQQIDAATLEQIKKSVLSDLKKADEEKEAEEAKKKDKAAKKAAALEAAKAEFIAFAQKSIAKGGLKKDMYTVSSLASLIQSLAWIKTDAAFEAAYEGDSSSIPEELQRNLESLIETFLGMAEEEAKELAATADKAGMEMSNTATTLTKAAVRKTTAERIEELKTLWKAQTAEMCDKLDAALATDESAGADGTEPKPVDLIGSGPKAAEKALSATDVEAMIKKAVDAAREEGAAAVIKMLKDAVAAEPTPAAPLAKEAGVGSREAAPFVPSFFAGSTPVSKSEDAGTGAAAAAEPVTLTPEDIQKATNGDRESIAKIRKSRTATAVPAHLMGSLSGLATTR